MDSDKVFQRFGVVFEGGGRYYHEDLSKRDYNLEFTTPHKMTIFDTTIQENAWGEMIRSVAFLLLQKYPDKTSSLLQFRSPWTRQSMFMDTKKVNWKFLAEGLYINCNHTALHACWFIQDLLKFYQVSPSEVTLFIHRPPAAEPEQVKSVLRDKCIKNFSLFLETAHQKSPDSVKIIIHDVEKHLNRWLAQVSQSYNDFFLFENATYVENYSKKVLEAIDQNYDSVSKYKIICTRVMSYVVEYYQLVGVQ